VRFGSCTRGSTFSVQKVVPANKENTQAGFALTWIAFVNSRDFRALIFVFKTRTFWWILAGACHYGFITQGGYMKIFTLILILFCLPTVSALSNNWVKVLDAQYVYDLAIAPSGTIYAISFTGGVWRSDNNGSSWSPINFPDSNLVAVCTTPLGHIYIGTWGHGFYRSTDYGSTWTATGPHNLKVTDIYSNTTGNIFVTTSGDSALYRSTDNGNTWHPIIRGILFTTVPKALSVVISGPNGLLYTAEDQVYQSTNNGDNWTSIGPSTTENLISLAWASPGYLYAGGLGGVYRTVDTGKTWDTVNFGSAQGFVRTLVVVSNGTVYRGTDNDGVYFTDDGGDNWYDFNTGLTGRSVFTLAKSTNGYLFAATFDNGIFRTTSPVADVAEQAPAIPGSPMLSQNYPNPFNPTTTFRFQIHQADHVTLGVFDAAGREITRLIDRFLPPGTYEQKFDGTGLSSGAYFCRMEAGNAIQIRKFVLLR
jgi:photosystem II stability/assembly factor-like uncharacterized protein